jgi:hypothetical protein
MVLLNLNLFRVCSTMRSHPAPLYGITSLHFESNKGKKKNLNLFNVYRDELIGVKKDKIQYFVVCHFEEAYQVHSWRRFALLLSLSFPRRFRSQVRSGPTPRY